MDYTLKVMTLEEYCDTQEEDMNRINQQLDDFFVNNLGKLLKHFGVTDRTVMKRFLDSNGYQIDPSIFNGKEDKNKALSDALDEHMEKQKQG